jgi:hypothetical protein
MPTLDDQGDDNDDVPPDAVHGPDGDDEKSPARCAAPPRRRGDMCAYRYESMTQRHMYDPDRTCRPAARVPTRIRLSSTAAPFKAYLVPPPPPPAAKTKAKGTGNGEGKGRASAKAQVQTALKSDPFAPPHGHDSA